MEQKIIEIAALFYGIDEPILKIESNDSYGDNYTELEYDINDYPNHWVVSSDVISTEVVREINDLISNRVGRAMILKRAAEIVIAAQLK